MTAGELDARLRRGDRLALLDVREDVERAFAAIPSPGTVPDLHIPMNEIPSELEAIRAAVGSAPLVVYCHHGYRSMTVAVWLGRQGFPDVANLEGGIDAWSAQVDPLVRRY